MNYIASHRHSQTLCVTHLHAYMHKHVCLYMHCIHESEASPHSYNHKHVLDKSLTHLHCGTMCYLQGHINKAGVLLEGMGAKCARHR